MTRFHKPDSRKPGSARFTNRTGETRRILDLLHAPHGSPLPLVMFYGVGGAGKSSLLVHLSEACNWSGVPCSLVDLAQAGTPTRALPLLAAGLQERAGFHFPGFLRVLAVLTAREAAGQEQALVTRLGGEGELIELNGWDDEQL